LLSRAQLPARLFGKRGEAKIEILLHKSLSDARWKVFARPAKKIKPNKQRVTLW
jgi:S-adenosylmethionine:tRNA ribosyltransferase-isomerase